jgi:hypothetical protein
LLAGAASATADEPIQWKFDSPRDVTEAVNMEPGLVANGRLSGQTAWDPHFSLRLPPGGIDARKLTQLTVRLYSSEQADLLDVYYQSPDKRWCLGGKFPIRKGWAVYRMDLVKNLWRETTTGPAAKQWGGPAKRVSSLRLDPGNQADRWVAVDFVRLAAAEPGFREGVTAEPRGTARLVEMHAPGSVAAGGRVSVSARFAVQAPPGMERATALILLRQGGTVMRWIEQPVALTGQTLTIQAELPISAYWYPAPLSVAMAFMELDAAPGSRPAAAEMQITGSRVGRVRPAVAELRRVGGDAAIFVDGQPLPGYMFTFAGGLHPGYHREIAAAGVHLYCDWFGSSTDSDMGHVAAERYDYSRYDRYFAAILDVDPQAYFLPHVGVTGARWWQQSHPEEMCQFENGGKGPTSFASEPWRRQMSDDLRRLIAYLRQAPYADRIIGYTFFNGYTAEWQMWGTWKTSRDDYSLPALRAFRAFLQGRYRTDQRLQAAWADPGVTLATAGMPGWAQRRPAGTQVLRDLEREWQAIDFYEFISAMDADALLCVARVMREATHGQSLVGTYYAYLTAHGINQQDSGHLAAQRVFDSPDIDFLMSPPNYWYRKPGEACTFMSASDSLRLRGKLWLDESDHRTHLTDPSAGYGRAATLAQTRGVFWRELAEVLTKRAAVSWFDMSGGWYSHPQVLADVGRGYRMMRESLPERRPFAPEIGVFVDPESFYYMRPTDANAALDLRQVATMPQSGAPWDFCLLADIGDARLPDYKLYLFLNAFRIDPARREAIHRKLKRNAATAVFAYAPGYYGPQGPSLASMQALTGIRIGMADVAYAPQILIEPQDPLAAGLIASKPLGFPHLAVSPMFYADDPGARVAGRLLGSGRPGLVVKPMDGWTSIYSAAMHLPPALIRNIVRAAGVHVWIETDDAIYADNQFVGLHAATDGTKRIHLPAGYQALDAVTGKPLASNAATVAWSMKKAETILLRLVPAAGTSSAQPAGAAPQPGHRP